jgi:predicted nucleic-acid-binding protein
MAIRYKTMIALDTNVWVRYVTNDDPVQAKKALQLIGSSEDIFLPITVLLEMEWVLRAVYGLPVSSIEQALLVVLGLPNVHVTTPEQISSALSFYRGGMDFADALHLAGSANVEAFYSFDEKFAKTALKFGSNVVSP